MNFTDAIQAHASWKMKLSTYLRNPDHSINVDNLSKDDICALGCWIYSDEAKKYYALPEFQELIKSHKEFHLAASEIVKRKNNGEDVQGDIVLGANSAFAKHSASVISMLMKLDRSLNPL